MDNVVKKCPKDGVQHEASYTGTCETCFGPLQYYCLVHHDWLTDGTCPRCAQAAASAAAPKPPAPSPAPPTPAAPAPSAPASKAFLGVLFGLGLFVLLIGSVFMIYKVVSRMLRPPEKTTETRSSPASVPARTTQVAAPVVTPTVPPPRVTATPAQEVRTTAAPSPFPTYPPISLNVNQILIDPEKYLAKLVQTSGTIQIKEPEKDSFDLREGDFTLPILYRLLTPEAKATILSTPLGRDVTVTGLVKRDEADNSYYVLAQRVEPH